MKLWLAPLHGITLYTFRNCLYKHTRGIETAITPFLPIQSSDKLNVKKWQDIWPNHNQNYEVIPQLMGNIPSDFLDTTQSLYDHYGYQSFNWNIGCPVAQIVRRRRGCGLMPFPDIIEETIQLITHNTSFKISIKMRLGLHRIDEGKEILQRLEQYPIDFIVIHPRLGEQQYNGTPDLDALAQLLPLTHHRIVYSGDICNLESFQHLQTLFPTIHDWMLGRGILANPFLAEQLISSSAQISAQERKRFYNFYHDLVTNLRLRRGTAGTLSNLKELWHYFAKFCNISDNELQALLRLNDLDLFLSLSETYITRMEK